MSDEASESLAAARRVDARCDEFELALATGKSPQIESFLTDLSASDRQTLLLELLGLELDFRVARGEQPKVGDYAKRFPELSAEQLAALVEASRGRAGVTPSIGPAVPNAEQPTILSPTDAVALAKDASAAALRRVRYFGDYELLREIARGGMGVVYEARQRSLNRPVALKMILSGQLASAEEVARFRREAEAAAQLEHPGIVPIFEIGTDGDQHYFTMGYVAGPSLSARLLDRPLEPREAATLIRDVALAVQYAHERGVVHRDLKPSNILLAPRGDSGHVRQNVGQSDVRPHSGECGYAPRITDFGLAKVSHADHSLTETGQILGTPSYMPPEQASGMTQLVGPAADIYSLGAVLYACLTGRPPFQAASVLDTVRQVLERDPVSLRDLNAAIPQDLETICLKCLEKSIPRRYSTAKEVADELQRYLEGRPILARPVSRAERFRRWCRRNPMIASLSAAVAFSLLLGIAVSSYFAWKENRRAISESNARSEEERQRREAVRQTGIANRLADENLKLAEDEKEAREKADLNADEANRQTKLAKRNLYAAHMNLIQAAWDANRVGEAVRILELYRPAVGQADDPDDLRSFEWHLWDHRCNSDLLTLKAPPNVLSVAFSPDGQRLVSGSIAETAVKVWDITSGREILSLKGHHGVLSQRLTTNDQLQATLDAYRETTNSTLVNCVTYSPDGQRIGSASGDGTAKLWDAATGAELLTFKGHSYQVSSVAFSPDGQKLVTTAFDTISANLPWEIKVWDANTGRELRSLQGTQEVVKRAVFSPDGKRLASSSGEKTGNEMTKAKVWDSETGELLLSIRGTGSGAMEVAFNPDGKRLATADADGTIKIWHIDSGQELIVLKGHLSHVTSVAFNATGDRLVSASADQTIKVWRADTGQELLTHKGHWERINSVTFSPNGTLLASASTDGTIKLWDAKINQEWRTLQGTHWFQAESGDGKFMATRDHTRIVNIRDSSTGVVKHSLNVLTRDGRGDISGLIADVALNHNAQQLAVGCVDATVRLFDVASGQETHALVGHTSTVSVVVFRSDGKQLVSGSNDRTVRVWDATMGREIRTLKGHTASVYGVAFSPDGSCIASTSADKTVRIWSAATGQLMQTLKGHDGIVQSAAFSPDGKRIASACFDRTVKLWDVESGQLLLTLKGHPSSVTQVAFSPDGKRVVSSGNGGPTKVWDSLTGQELVTFNGWSLAGFSPGGKGLCLKTGAAGSVVIGDLSPRIAATKLDLAERSAKLAARSEQPEAITEQPRQDDRFRQDAALTWKGWSKDAPPPAIAPFNAEQAEQSQAAWAKHLNVPVEFINSIGMKFRLVPPGEFLMGSTPEDIDATLKSTGSDTRWHVSIRSEGPQHKVVLTQPIYLGVHEVTQGEYEQILKKNPSHFSPTGAGKAAVAGLDTKNFPVDSESWVDAAEFCTKLSEKESLQAYYLRADETATPLGGTGYRLPTEAEWEFASRAGTSTRFWIGDTDAELMQVGWFNTNTGGRTHEVGSLQANPFGLFDMNGNLWEWVQDGWDSNYYRQYQDKPAFNPCVLPFNNPQRVLRGGSWASTAIQSRSAYRHTDATTLRHRNCGFRIALSVEAARTTIARQKQTEGDKHREQQKYSEAIACYREVVTHEPNNLATLNRMTWLLALSPAKAEQAAEAQELAQHAIGKDPNNFYYRNTLGAAQYRTGQFAAALRNLGEVEQTAPPDFQWRAHNLLFQAMCHQKLGDRQKAQAAYEKALELLKRLKEDTNPWREARLLQREFESLR